MRTRCRTDTLGRVGVIEWLAGMAGNFQNLVGGNTAGSSARAPDRYGLDPRAGSEVGR